MHCMHLILQSGQNFTQHHGDYSHHNTAGFSLMGCRNAEIVHCLVNQVMETACSQGELYKKISK